MLTKFVKLIKILLSGNLQFFLPIKKEVVLYDKTKILDLRYFLNINRINILHIRGEKLNALILLKCFFKLKFNFIDYCNEYINHVNPKVILTFLDNYPQFYLLNKKKDQKKILIQNAFRTGDDSPLGNVKTKIYKQNDKIKVDHAFSFNKNVSKKYVSLLGCKVHEIGSFRSNLIKVKKKKLYDYLYVSSFRENIGEMKVSNYTNYKKFIKPEEKLVRFLFNYLKIKKKKLFILGSHKSDYKKEKKYFNEILKTSDWIFLKPKKFSHSYSYKQVDKAKLVIGIDSTLLFESFSRNSKIICFNVRPSDPFLRKYRYFGWPKRFKKQGPFWSDKLTQKNINHVIKKVSSTKDKDWTKIRKKYLNDFISFNKNNYKFSKIVRKALR